MGKTFLSEFDEYSDFKKQGKKYMNHENEDWHDIFSDKKQKEKSRRNQKKNKHCVADWGY